MRACACPCYSVMVFWRLVLACTFSGPTFTDLLVSTGVLCVCSDEEQRRKEQKNKKKIKKRHQPENDGKTGKVGKMGEDTENNIGKKMRMVSWSLQKIMRKVSVAMTHIRKRSLPST